MIKKILKKEANVSTRTKGPTEIGEKNSGTEQANKDFNRLRPVDVKILRNPKGEIKIGTLKDGSKITVREFSSDGRNTLEVRGKNGRGYEIRYDK